MITVNRGELHTYSW